MSKLPAVVVALSRPLDTRSFRNETCYVAGRTSLKPVADGILPMVSSFAQVNLDDDFNTVWEVKTVYCYNRALPLDQQTWHQFGELKTFTSLKQAVRETDSAMREAYSYALERGIAAEIGGRF